MAVCPSIIIPFSYPSANSMKLAEKKQRTLNYEMPTGILKMDIF